MATKKATAASKKSTKASAKAVKEEVKETAAPVVEVKEEVKAEAPVVEEKKAKAAETKKTASRTAKASAKAAKEEVKETAAPVVEVKEEVKAEAKAEVFVEFGGAQVSIDKVVEDVKKTFAAEGNDEEVKSVKVYLKPEDSAAYYVVNDTIEGKIVVYFVSDN